MLRNLGIKRLIVTGMVSAFLGSFLRPSYAQELTLPAPGTMVNLSSAYVPVLIKGLRVHPDNPLLFDFILDTGKSGLKINSLEFKNESDKLIKYFLASLTIKEDDLWVNLSPYEKNRIIPNQLGQTELGRDMLAQDYILKQLTASLIYPEKKLGKEFWNAVYAEAQQEFGTSDIPVNTFNKVWIIADKAKILERNNIGYVVNAHLKVMLEEDYLALKNHTAIGQVSKTHTVASQVVREIIIPALDKEVNQGRNFAPLRQMFYSMILASWYKLALKNALLNQVYSNKEKTGGILSNDPAAKEKIFQRYLQAYKKGVFNFIQEDMDAVSKQPMPRKYFSGGLRVFPHAPEVEKNLSAGDDAMGTGDMAMETVGMTKQTSVNSDAAMSNNLPVDNNNFFSSLLADPDLMRAAEAIRPKLQELVQERAGTSPLTIRDINLYFLNDTSALEAMHYRKIEFNYLIDVIRYSGINLDEESQKYIEEALQIFRRILATNNIGEIDKIIDQLRGLTLDKKKTMMPLVILTWLGNAAESDLEEFGEQKESARIFLERYVNRMLTRYNGKPILDGFVNFVNGKIRDIEQKENLKQSEILLVSVLTSGSELGEYVSSKLGVPVHPLILTTAMTREFGRMTQPDGTFQRNAPFTDKGRLLATQYLEQQGIITSDNRYKYIVFIDSGNRGTFGMLMASVLSSKNIGSTLLLLRHGNFQEIGLEGQWADGLNEQESWKSEADNILFLQLMLDNGVEHSIEIPFYKVAIASGGKISVIQNSTKRTWWANVFREQLGLEVISEAGTTLDNELVPQLRAGYDKKYAKIREAEEKGTGQTDWNRPQKAMGEEVEIAINGRNPEALNVLNLGAGDGAGGGMDLVKKGLRNTHVDLSAEAISLFRDRVRNTAANMMDRNQFEVGDMLEVLKTLKDGSFDIVHAHLSLQYHSKEKLYEILRQIRRVLKPDGKFLFKVHSMEDTRLINRNQWKQLEKGESFYEMPNGEVTRFFTEDFINQLLKDTGFKLSIPLKKVTVEGWYNKPWVAVAQKDFAQTVLPPGGIDLNAKNMAMAVDREGNGIEMNFDPAMVAEFRRGNFSGIVANIIRIIPIKSPLPMMGLDAA